MKNKNNKFHKSVVSCPASGEARRRRQLSIVQCKSFGFTLVESLIYSTLLAVFLVSTFFITTQLLENSNKIRDKLEVNEEAEFIFKKIEWALVGATTTTLPAVNSTGTVLRITKANFANNPIEFSLNDGNVYLGKGSTTATRLNSGRMKVSGLLFDHRRDNTYSQSIIVVTLTAENISEEGGLIFPASTTLETSYRI